MGSVSKIQSWWLVSWVNTSQMHYCRVHLLGYVNSFMCVNKLSQMPNCFCVTVFIFWRKNYQRTLIITVLRIKTILNIIALFFMMATIQSNFLI
jgi:hypothetical protein